MGWGVGRAAGPQEELSWELELRVHPDQRDNLQKLVQSRWGKSRWGAWTDHGSAKQEAGGKGFDNDFVRT